MHKELEEGSDSLAVGQHKSPQPTDTLPATETRVKSASIAQAMSAANSPATSSAAAAAAAAAAATSSTLQRTHSNNSHHQHGHNASPNNSMANTSGSARQASRRVSGSASSKGSTPQHMPQSPHSRHALPTHARQALRAGGSSQGASPRAMPGASDPGVSGLVARALAHYGKQTMPPSTASGNAATGGSSSAKALPTPAPHVPPSMPAATATASAAPAASSAASASFAGPVPPHPSTTSSANPAHQHQPQQPDHQQQQQQQQQEEASNTMVAKFVLNMWLADKLSPNSLPLLREACLHVLQHVCKEHALPAGSTIKQEAEQRLQFFDVNSLKAAVTGHLGHPNHGHQAPGKQQPHTTLPPAASSLVRSQTAGATGSRFSSSLTPSASASTAATAAPVVKPKPHVPAHGLPPSSSSSSSSLANLGQHGQRHRHHHQQQRATFGSGGAGGTAAANGSSISSTHIGGSGSQQRRSSIFSHLQRQHHSPFSTPAFPDTTMTDALYFQDSLADTAALGTGGFDLPAPAVNDPVHADNGDTAIGASMATSTSATDLSFLLAPGTTRMAQPDNVSTERWTDTESLGMGLIPDVSDLLFDGVLGFDNEPLSRVPHTGSNLPAPHQQQQQQQQLRQHKREPLPGESIGAQPPYVQTQVAQLRQQGSQLGSNSDDDKPSKRPKVICPVCAGPGRDTASRVCGLCYNGVYNDIKKYLKREQQLNPSVLVDIDRFIHELQVMPRGCEKDYTCTQADYAFDLPQYEKCTRCRSLAVSRAAPELVTQMIRKGLDKEKRRREKEAAALS